jgi:hypothetical protein
METVEIFHHFVALSMYKSDWAIRNIYDGVSVKKTLLVAIACWTVINCDRMKKLEIQDSHILREC